MKVFSKAAFEKNAERGIKNRIPASHREAADGQEVVGETVNYEVDGLGYHLYPVDDDWTEEVDES